MNVMIIEEYVTERFNAWRLEIDGEFLCKVYKEENAKTMVEWLKKHGINGKSVYSTRPFQERFAFEGAVMGNRSPFDFMPWVSR